MSRNKWKNEKLFFRLLNNKSDKTYWDNISVLRKRTSQDVFEKCAELIKSKNPKERIIGIDVLAQLGLPPRQYYNESKILFFELLESENDPKVIMSVLYAIGHNQEKLTTHQINQLCKLQSSKNELIKEGLVFALNGIDNTKAITALIKLSSDKNSNIRNWATFGLGTQINRNTNRISDALWNRVNDKNQEIKLEAIVGLVKRKDSRIKDIVKRELLAGEYGILLLEAIIEIGDLEILDILKQRYKIELKNDNINPEWLKDLKKCIKLLDNNIKINN